MCHDVGLSLVMSLPGDINSTDPSATTTHTFFQVPVFRSVPFLCVGLYLHSLGLFISYRWLSISGLLGISWGLQIFLGTSNTGILPDTVAICHDTP